MKQVNVDGYWHRLLHGTIGETACGEEYNTEFGAPRTFSLKGPLCRNCFTIRELAISDDIADGLDAGIGVRRRKRSTTVDP